MTDYKKICLRIEPQSFDELKRISRVTGVPYNEIMRRMITSYLRQMGKKYPADAEKAELGL